MLAGAGATVEGAAEVAHIPGDLARRCLARVTRILSELRALCGKAICSLPT